MTAMAILTRPDIQLPGSCSHIMRRTHGRGHGPIVRLISPPHFGEIVKPVVFLDLFEADKGMTNNAMQLHPQSGIVTVTVFTKDDAGSKDAETGEGAHQLAPSQDAPGDGKRIAEAV